MSDLLAEQHGATDAELIAAVRSGDSDAYAELFGRHRDAANRLARQLMPPADADDLVAESFARMLAVLQGGGGPDEFFRAYLLTTIRRLHIDRIRAGKRVRTTDDEAELDRHVEFVDTAAMRFERSAAAEAFASLPERWRMVLWHLDVEGQKPADIAPLLGMSANSVSALAYRAREGLRQAYLQGHLAAPIDDGCRWTTGQLGSYVRKGLSKRDTAKVEAHLDECSRCAALYLELAEVNSNLAGILAPALLGTAAAGYLGGGTTAVAGLLGFLGRPFRQAARSVPPTVVALAGVAAAATIATVVVVQTSGGQPAASAPVPRTPVAASVPTPSLPAPSVPKPSVVAADPASAPAPIVTVPPAVVTISTSGTDARPKPAPGPTKSPPKTDPDPGTDPNPGTDPDHGPPFSLGPVSYTGIPDYPGGMPGAQAHLTVTLSALPDPGPDPVNAVVRVVLGGDNYLDGSSWPCRVEGFPDGPDPVGFLLQAGTALLCSGTLSPGADASLTLDWSPFDDAGVAASLTIDGQDAGSIPPVPLTPPAPPLITTATVEPPVAESADESVPAEDPPADPATPAPEATPTTPPEEPPATETSSEDDTPPADDVENSAP